MRLGIGIAIVFLAGTAAWWWATPRAPVVPPPIDLSRYAEIEITERDAEVVGDWGDGKLTAMRATHLLTGNVASNSTDPTELRFYEHLVFGDRLDNMREKNHCHFRVRIRGAAAQIGLDDLILVLSTDRDQKVLRFERIYGDIASEPYIFVDARRSPNVPGLHELLAAPNKLSYEYRILRRNP